MSAQDPEPPPQELPDHSPPPHDAGGAAGAPPPPRPISEAEIEERGLFGSYARGLGWSRGQMGGAAQDPTVQLRAFL